MCNIDDNDNDNELELENEPVYCPVCSGDAVLLGNLGILAWYRCQDCGMEFSKREAWG